MSYGMTATNLSGFVQVAEPFDNVSVYATGTTSTVNYFAFGWPGIYLPSNAPDDLLVFARPSLQSGSYKFSLAINRNIVIFGGFTGKGIFFYDTDTNTGQSIDYIILTKSQAMPEPTSGYGLNVYNSSGNLAFTSEYGTSRVYSSRTNSITSITFSSVYPNVGGELLDNTWVLMNPFSFFAQQQVGSKVNLYSYKVKFDYTNNQLSSLVDIFGVLQNVTSPLLINSSPRVEMLARF